MKILISGGQQLVALKIHNKLKNNFEIVLADYGDIPSIGGANNPICALGEWNENILAHEILKHCIELEIDLYIPLYEKEWPILNRARVLFEEFGIQLATLDKTVQTQFTYSTIFQEIMLYINGTCVFNSLPEKVLDIPILAPNFTGLLGYTMSADVANFTFITIN